MGRVPRVEDAEDDFEGVGVCVEVDNLFRRNVEGPPAHQLCRTSSVFFCILYSVIHDSGSIPD